MFFRGAKSLLSLIAAKLHKKWKFQGAFNGYVLRSANAFKCLIFLHIS